MLWLTLLSFSKARVICDPWFVSSEKKRKKSVVNAIKQKLWKYNVIEPQSLNVAFTVENDIKQAKLVQRELWS